MLPLVGQRVVRGPDWESGDEDGGDGNVGTVVALKDGSSGDGENTGANIRTRTNGKVLTVNVAWDNGTVGECRTGQDGKYDLCAVDVGLGGSHLLARCDICRCTPSGFRWYCLVCKSFDLCNTCYNKNEHDLDHLFSRFVATIGSFVRVPTRQSSAGKRIEARGLFVGAKVSKDSKKGTVTETLGFRNQHERGAVKVQWEGQEEATVHPRDEAGDIGLTCDEAAIYGTYYKDHLPKLGQRDYIMVGDLAAVLKTEDETKQMQEGHGDWVEPMAVALRQVAIIVAVTYRGDVKLHFPAIEQEWDFNNEAVTRLEEFGVGDTVRVIDDEESVKRYQPGHGDWKDEMAQSLGQDGTVLMVQRTGDIKVLVNGQPWTLHPACLTLVKAEEQRRPTDWEEAQEVIMLKAMQDQLILGQMGVAFSTVNSKKEDIIRYVKNAHEGNLAGVKEALEQNPSWINIQVSRRTALHMACMSGHQDVVKFLLSKNANIETKDDKGFRPLHCAVLAQKPKLVEFLMRQGAYPSPVNGIGLTPLHLAACKGFHDCASVLLKNGCNINIQDQCGDVALHFAIVGESKECQKLLIESPLIDLLLRNNKGYNALHFAALRDSELAMNMILDRIPALAQNRKEDGFAAIHIAALNNHVDIIKILLDKGKVPVDCLTFRQESALYLAVSRGATETVELLVTRGANINIPNRFGQTCMHIIVELLKEPAFEVEDSLTLRKIRASMREIGVSSPGGALACFLARNGGKLDTPDKDNERPWDLIVDPKLRECLEKCMQASFSPQVIEAPKKPKNNSLLARILPFLNREREPEKTPEKKTMTPVEVTYNAQDNDVLLSINPFDMQVGDEITSELPASPLDEINPEQASADQVVTDEDLNKNVEKGAEHACTVCEEPLTQLIGIPCQHVQTLPGEESSSAAGATAAPRAEPPRRAVSALRRQNSEFRSALACTVCFQRKKAVVFECGHSTCKECAELLPDCPVCRKPATKVFPLFL